jgi:hypothetical protein
VRALEVAENDDRYAGIGGAYRRIPFCVEFGEIVGEGVGSSVKHFAAEESFTVFTDED